MQCLLKFVSDERALFCSHVSDNTSPLVHVAFVQWLLCLLFYVFWAGQ